MCYDQRNFHCLLLAHWQKVLPVPLHALRGTILDRDGTVLAYTTPARDVVTDPTLIKPADRAAVADDLAPLWVHPALVEQALFNVIENAAKYGGGIFLLIYILLAFTFGYTMIVAETALGRMTKKSPVGAFAE